MHNGIAFSIFQLVEAFEISESIQIFIHRSQTEE